MNTDTFKLIETLFQKTAKKEIKNYLNNEIDNLIIFLKNCGYKVDKNGFNESIQDIVHKDNILEKTHLLELIYILNGLNGNWDIKSVGSLTVTIQYYKRLEVVFQGLYDTAI